MSIGVSGRENIIHLDVDQASATLVQYGEETYLIDGDRKRHADKIKETIESGTIDAAFVTHGHRDHVNGVRSLLESDDVSIDRLYVPTEKLYERKSVSRETIKDVCNDAEKHDIPVEQVDSSGEVGPIQYDVPYESPPIADNDGLIARVEISHTTTVILGDSTPEQLNAIDASFLEGTDTIVMAHHGSKENFELGMIPDETLRNRGIDPEDVTDHAFANVLSEETREQLAIDSTADKQEVDERITTREEFEAVAQDISIDYLETAAPDRVVISSDPAFRGWGHPNRLTMAGICGSGLKHHQVLHTRAHGDIEISPLGPKSEYTLPDGLDIWETRLYYDNIKHQLQQENVQRESSGGAADTDDGTGIENSGVDSNAGTENRERTPVSRHPGGPSKLASENDSIDEIDAATPDPEVVEEAIQGATAEGPDDEVGQAAQR